jgi:hypothetical protein
MLLVWFRLQAGTNLGALIDQQITAECIVATPLPAWKAAARANGHSSIVQCSTPPYPTPCMPAFKFVQAWHDSAAAEPFTTQVDQLSAQLKDAQQQLEDKQRLATSLSGAERGRLEAEEKLAAALRHNADTKVCGRGGPWGWYLPVVRVGEVGLGAASSWVGFRSGGGSHIHCIGPVAGSSSWVHFKPGTHRYHQAQPMYMRCILGRAAACRLT